MEKRRVKLQICQVSQKILSQVGLGNNLTQNFVTIKSMLLFVLVLYLKAKHCFVLVNLEENQKRKDYLSWDEYFMSAAFLTAMRSKV